MNHSVLSMIKDILRREGGFTQNPSDPGHQLRVANGDKWDSYCTNFGVTQYTLSSYWKRQATISDVRELSQDEAIEIYRSEYFFKPGLNGLAPDLQPVMFDMAINHGPRRAVKILQTVCTKAGFALEIDGRMGFRTKRQSSLCFDLMGGWMVNALVEERIHFYDFLIARDPQLGQFKKGWYRRAKEFLVRDAGEAIAVRMINERRKAA